MSRILLEVPLDVFSVEEICANPKAVCKYLHAIAKSDVEDALHDSEAYVPDFDDTVDDYILGAIDPHLLKSKVSDWNAFLWQELLQTIDGFLRDAAKNAADKADLNAELLNSAATYALKKAALAADNCFFDFAEHIVDLQNEMGFTYLCTTLSDRQLAGVMAAPEEYAIIPIWVK